MFYVTQLQGDCWYVCPYYFRHRDPARLPRDLDRAYETKAEATDARNEAERRLKSSQ